MYRALFERFAAECVRQIAAGEGLDDERARLFLAYLAAREASGRRLLGARAGGDPSFDTVSGRCGIRPAFADCDFSSRIDR